MTTIIHHQSCPDGFASALVTHEALVDLGHHADQITIVGATYGDDPPPLIHGEAVYICDFCFEPHHLREIAQVAGRLVVLDHHQTSRAWMEACSRLTSTNMVYQDINDSLADDGDVVFVSDMDRSGVGLAMVYWDWPKTNDAVLLDIEDRDLWRFSRPTTKDTFAAVTSRPYDLQVWRDMLDTPHDELVTEGRAINRYRDQLIEQAVEEAWQQPLAGFDDNWVVPCPYAYGSDVAGILAERDPERFAAYFMMKPGGVKWGLRSTDEGMDVAAIAEVFAGGGHRHASGFFEVTS